MAWGSYSRFVAYTAKLLWLLPPACPPRLMPATRPAPKARTLRSYYEEWIETKFLRSFERTTTETNTVRSLRTMPRRLHSDASEFVFLSPEGKPMTDTWWPKRGAARRPVDDESKGIWFRCLRSLGIRPRKFYMTRHTFIAWALSEGVNMKGLAEYCGTSVQMIEQSYGRYIRKDFLGPLIAARPKSLRRVAAAGENRTPLGGFGKKAGIS